MTVEALDHVNIITPDMDGTITFYTTLLQLEARDGPPPFTPQDVRWLYDKEGRAIIHINRAGAFQAFARDISIGKATGALHHVALRCSGFDPMVERIQAMGLNYHYNDVPAVSLRQIFVTDPNDVLLELNFFSG